MGPVARILDRKIAGFGEAGRDLVLDRVGRRYGVRCARQQQDRPPVLAGLAAIGMAVVPRLRDRLDRVEPDLGGDAASWSSPCTRDPAEAASASARMASTLPAACENGSSACAGKWVPASGTDAIRTRPTVSGRLAATSSAIGEPML